MIENTTIKPVIDIQNLKISFGSLNVLNDVSLQLKSQENLVVLGKSGTGKSVLIKCIARLLKADQGTITVLGEEVNALKTEDLNEIRKKIGFLFQSGALYDSMTVKENLEFPLRRIKKDLTQSEIDAKVTETLANVGLEDVLNKMPSELSGGMRKRISLARTIIVDPEIMLYDEPTTGLDPITAEEISELINDIQKKYKTASIIITHDMECVRTVADRIIMLKDGDVYKEGSLLEFENSTDSYVSSFFKTKKIQ
ncbi:ABC transporter ATP-binding protein [Flavobacterium aquatile]|uniref:Organic solvent ABC transporter ATP-binding protein n=1 Tax=Flavobacterium aquatile LMG 4008 = ATCC 11947 TaxID=1453498 RepID=A0A095SSS6_9FLAO|nr:ATP-binding cassette domain-containing protein [Flavobacterium aquatile]KGD67419.1 organic solvent ABC transporter ATP-binding protein [Flavobacterium aquatile LMG 4008 = ATCC 11947]OXA66955.1 ABC transporter ATP-binding protein [Flavobacterium aquatile LMG 4008 = ATCC 11947]GEC78794.1 ABC transporter ATP-binding protein [Flavobacterium aquatile]